MRQISFIILFTFFIGSVRAQSTSDSLVMNYMQDMEIPLTYNNKVELLMTGREKFIDLFETIRHARHHIHLEYFNFRNDSIANALFDLLAEKVKEGVEVRAMFDAFGNWSNNQPLKNIIAGDKGTRHRARQVRPHHLSLYQPCHASRPPEDSGYRRKNRLYGRDEYCRLLHQRLA